MPLAIKEVMKLNNGFTMPIYGFGTWQAPESETFNAVKCAVRSGFRLIDCAKVYGNQKFVGNAIAQLIAEKVVTREELFVVSKVWNTDHHPSDVIQSTKQTIEDLQVGYLDLLLIHWPVAWVKYPNNANFKENKEGGSDINDAVSLLDTWKAMEQLVDEKLVRSIGVSNFNEQELRELYAAARIKPVTNQIEVHPALPQTQMRKVHIELGMVTMAYCPLGIGFGRSHEQTLLGCADIRQLAAETKMTPAQLLLRWGLNQPRMCVLSKSVSDARIAENAALLADPLPVEIAQKLEVIGKQNPMRVCNPEFFRAVAGTFFSASEGY